MSQNVLNKTLGKETFIFLPFSVPLCINGYSLHFHWLFPHYAHVSYSHSVSCFFSPSLRHREQLLFLGVLAVATFTLAQDYDGDDDGDGKCHRRENHFYQNDTCEVPSLEWSEKRGKKREDIRLTPTQILFHAYHSEHYDSHLCVFYRATLFFLLCEYMHVFHQLTRDIVFSCILKCTLFLFFLFVRIDFFSGGSDDDDDFAAASGTPGQSTSSDDTSGVSYGSPSAYGGASSYGSDAGGVGGGLGALGLGGGASPFAGAASLPSLYGAYGAASHPKVKIAAAPKRK